MSGAEREESGVLLDGARAAGCDPDALRRAFGLLQGWVDEGVLPGAGALVARDGVVAGEAYVGLANREAGRPVTSGTIWSLASVTKPFTATAVMLLVEEGRLSLDDPLHELLPEFLDVPEGPFDRRAVTLRHALAHCSGLPGFSADNTQLRRDHRPLEAFVPSFGGQPLLFAPGTAHYYSNPGVLLAAEAVGRALEGTLGARVEQPAVGRYHPFVEEDILAPLAMGASALRPPEAWDERIARVEGTNQQGESYEMANSRYYRSLGIPWGGLFSRPRELARFVDLFLPGAGGKQRIGAGNGDGGGARVVSPATARVMTSVQFSPPEAPPDLAPELRESAARTPPLPAVEWGVGWTVKGAKRPHFSGELTGAGAYGHVGVTGTMVWADPASGVSLVLLTNRTLASGWTRERPRQALFSNAVLASLR